LRFCYPPIQSAATFTVPFITWPSSLGAIQARRPLEIREKSFGGDHPDVAAALNNLASLLQATNRPAETAPLMRLMVGIFVHFTRATGHPHPHLQAAIGNYKSLLQKMGRSEKEIQTALRAIAPEIF
jgi:hypothetical protein